MTTNINNRRNKHWIMIVLNTLKNFCIAAFSIFVKYLKAVGAFLQTFWKALLYTFSVVIIIVICFAGYDFYTHTYVPNKLLAEAINKIESEFTSENDSIKISYSFYILQKDRDWAIEDVDNGRIRGRLSDNYTEAFQNIENAAYKGNSRAQFLLGQLYGWGCNLFEPDDAKAAYWWNEAALQGYQRAYNNLGIAYENGDGVRKDLRLAVEWIKKGAEAGEEYAQWNYGRYFRDGVNIKIGSHREQRQTKNYYSGSKDDIIREYWDYSSHDMVTVYWVSVDDYETIVPVDIEQAKYWWKKAASQGNKAAKNALQKIYN